MPKDSLRDTSLTVTLGQSSQAGRKSENQDFIGAIVPEGKALGLKGVTLALADGISTSRVSREAAELAVKSLLEDYYHTSDAWTVETAASRVIAATNAWLYGCNRAALYDSPDQGRICTLSALIVKGCFAHLFHIGDSRVWRLSGSALEPLTEDHVTRVSSGETVLGRAMGLNHTVAIDYREIPVEPGDVFLLTSDGVHDFWQPKAVAETIRAARGAGLEQAAEQIVAAALEAGSDDNLSLQILRIDALPSTLGAEALALDTSLPVLPHQEAGALVDGFRIIRMLHSNNRSHIYLAAAPGGDMVALKIPATETNQDAEYMRRFLMEEWIARRITSAHVIEAAEAPELRSSLYMVTEYIEGQTLRQWMADNPNPPLSVVRDLAGQMIKGLRAFHRKDMLHQDFRPENVMIDRDGTLKIIDLGSAHVAGVQEALPPGEDRMMGTLQYSAPEYIVGDPASSASDQFSLGVVIYEMLTGRLPYRADAARISSRRDAARLVYRDARDDGNAIPYWVDAALRRATHPVPAKRFAALSEFEAALRQPPPNADARGPTPLIARDPLRFWQGLSAVLALAVLLLLLR